MGLPLNNRTVHEHIRVEKTCSAVLDLMDGLLRVIEDDFDLSPNGAALREAWMDTYTFIREERAWSREGMGWPDERSCPDHGWYPATDKYCPECGFNVVPVHPETRE